MDPGSSIFRVIAGLASEKEQKMNNSQQEQQPQRRRSSISELITQFGNMVIGGVTGSESKQQSQEQQNTQARKSIDDTKENENIANKQQNLEHARRVSIAILQTIRTANANADPYLKNQEEQQKQIEEAIKIFENLTNDPNDVKSSVIKNSRQSKTFNADFWNSAFNDYENRAAKQEAFRNQPYNRNHTNTVVSRSNNRDRNGIYRNKNNNNNNYNDDEIDNDGQYDIDNARFVDFKENEDHGIFNSIKALENEDPDEYNFNSNDLQREVERLQKENNILKQQINYLQNDNHNLKQSKFELINNTSRAMQEYKRMVKKYNRLVNG